MHGIRDGSFTRIRKIHSIYSGYGIKITAKRGMGRVCSKQVWVWVGVQAYLYLNPPHIHTRLFLEFFRVDWVVQVQTLWVWIKNTVQNIPYFPIKLD